MKALIIIDMQQESFSDATPCYDAKGVIKRINTLSKKFRDATLPVILIQHDGSLQNEYVPGTPGWELLPELEVSPIDIRISKTANDMFYETGLHDLLDTHHVNELVITGCATDFCVDASIQSALVKNYTVIVVKDGHTAGERSHLAAEKIIEHYNWVWENLTPTNGKIKMTQAADVM